jgi:hypothetical protein
MKRTDELDDELKNLSPFLRDLKRKKEPLKVPDGYFEQMEQSVFQKLEAAGAQRKPVLRPQKSLQARLFNPRLMMAAAAAISIALAAWWFLMPPTAMAPPNLMAMDMSDEELESYLLENIHEFDLDQLASLDQEELPVENTPTTSPEPASKSKPNLDDLKLEDVESILKDMSDEELEQLL